MDKKTRILEVVAAGAVLLDRNEPGWFRTLNGRALIMSDCTLCVLGLLYGTFRKGLRALGIPANFVFAEVGGAAGEYGFTAPSDLVELLSDERSELWDLLAAAWQREIRTRIAKEPSFGRGRGTRSATRDAWRCR